ncbi:MAG: carbohydrate kinase family protein [Gammaproteobacteria bacterium]
MIVCCGEALIDMIPKPTTEGATAFQPFTGGAVFNTAIALGRLDTPTELITGLSRDLFGEQLTAALADSGVGSAHCVRSDRPTTLAFVRLVNGQASYSFYDENSAGRMLDEADFPALPGSMGAAFFGGISLISEPCGTAYEALFTRLSDTCVTMVDVNVRPTFISDEAAYRARVERMTARADIVKLSDEDIRWLYGAGEEDAAARRMLAAGAKVVAITLGSQGVRAHYHGGTVEVAARKAEVVDTVGAGDTFNAGLLASLHDDGALTRETIARVPEDMLRRALELGVRAAAVTVARSGANPPRRDEL